MRHILSILPLLTLSIAAAAQEPADTLLDLNLQEVVIEAPKVIRKADMDVYRPSASAVEHSSNGVQLLRNLMIPTLSVNDPLGQISAAGESVQLRINGRHDPCLAPRAIPVMEAALACCVLDAMLDTAATI